MTGRRVNRRGRRTRGAVTGRAGASLGEVVTAGDIRPRTEEGEARRAGGQVRSAAQKLRDRQERYRFGNDQIQRVQAEGGDFATIDIEVRIDAMYAFGRVIRNLLRTQFTREDEASANQLDNADEDLFVGEIAPFDPLNPFFRNKEEVLLPGEIFRRLPNTDKVYFISNLGRICTNGDKGDSGIMKQDFAVRHGTPYLNIHTGGARRRRKTEYLVMDAFCEMPEEHAEIRDYVIHLDGNSENCSFLNMRRATYDEFYAYAEEHLPRPNNLRARIQRTRVTGFAFDPFLTPNDKAQSPIYYIREDGRVFLDRACRQEMEYRIGYGVRKVKFLLRNGNERMIPVGDLLIDTFIGLDPLLPYTIHLDFNRLNDTLENLEPGTREDYVEHTIESLLAGSNDPTEEMRLMGEFEGRFYDNYIISNRARIYSLHAHRFMTIEYFPDSYVFIQLCTSDPHEPKKYTLLHRVVCNTFNGPIPPGFFVDHVDGNKNNNFSENLEAVTPAENIRRALIMAGGAFARMPFYYEEPCYCGQVNEEWRRLERYRGYDISAYEVSNHGRIRNRITGRLLNTRRSRGYVCTTLGGLPVSYHRLTAITFLGLPANPLAIEVDHIDEVRHNNHVHNLRWLTPQENTLRQRRNIPLIRVTDITTGDEYIFPTWAAATIFPFPIGGVITERAFRNTMKGRSGPVRERYVADRVEPEDTQVVRDL